MYVDPRRQAALSVLAPIASLVVSTGLLCILLVAAAVLAGTSFGEFYRALPTRDFALGTKSDLAVEVLGRAIFLAYVATAVVLTLVFRRRLTIMWHDSRDSSDEG